MVIERRMARVQVTIYGQRRNPRGVTVMLCAARAWIWIFHLSFLRILFFLQAIQLLKGEGLVLAKHLSNPLSNSKGYFTWLWKFHIKIVANLTIFHSFKAYMPILVKTKGLYPKNGVLYKKIKCAPWSLNQEVQ